MGIARYDGERDDEAPRQKEVPPPWKRGSSIAERTMEERRRLLCCLWKEMESHHWGAQGECWRVMST